MSTEAIRTLADEMVQAVEDAIETASAVQSGANGLSPEVDVKDVLRALNLCRPLARKVRDIAYVAGGPVSQETLAGTDAGGGTIARSAAIEAKATEALSKFGDIRETSGNGVQGPHLGELGTHLHSAQWHAQRFKDLCRA